MNCWPLRGPHFCDVVPWRPSCEPLPRACLPASPWPPPRDDKEEEDPDRSPAQDVAAAVQPVPPPAAKHGAGGAAGGAVAGVPIEGRGGIPRRDPGGALASVLSPGRVGNVPFDPI